MRCSDEQHNIEKKGEMFLIFPPPSPPTWISLALLLKPPPQTDGLEFRICYDQLGSRLMALPPKLSYYIVFLLYSCASGCCLPFVRINRDVTLLQGLSFIFLFNFKRETRKNETRVKGGRGINIPPQNTKK